MSEGTGVYVVVKDTLGRGENAKKPENGWRWYLKAKDPEPHCRGSFTSDPFQAMPLSYSQAVRYARELEGAAVEVVACSAKPPRAPDMETARRMAEQACVCQGKECSHIPLVIAQVALEKMEARMRGEE